MDQTRSPKTFRLNVRSFLFRLGAGDFYLPVYSSVLVLALSVVFNPSLVEICFAPPPPSPPRPSM